MKKIMKRLAITTMVIFALLGVSGTIAYASGYITWGGAQDYQQALDNLAIEYEQLVSEHENTYRENEQLLNTIKDKEDHINSLDQLTETLHNMLQQAEHELQQKERGAK